MRSHLITLLLLVCCFCEGSLVSADDALRNASVFIEAEEFGPTGQQWTTGSRWADDIYSPTSGDAVLANPGEGKDEVHKDVVFPCDGTYNVWIRYLKIGKDSGSFGLRIEQNGQVMFDGKYRTQPKGVGWEPTWEKFPAALKAGPARLTFYIAEPGMRQRIDCVLLTTNLEYGVKQHPDYHDFAPQVFIRYRFLHPPVPTTARVQSYIRRGPNYYNDLGEATNTGLATGGGENPTGEWSPWYEITKIMDTDKFIATVHLHFRSAGKPVERSRLELQVATEPNASSATTLSEDLEGDIMTVLIPGNVRKYPEAIELASHNTRKHLETARGFGFPPLPQARCGRGAARGSIISAGATPFPGICLETHVLGYGSMYNSKKMLAEETEVTSILGINALDELIGPKRQIAASLGITRSYLQRWIPYQAFSCLAKADNAKVIEDYYRAQAEQIIKADPDALRVVYRNKLCDEPWTVQLDHISKCENCTAAFREYVRHRGFTPLDFGRTDWNAVGVIQRDAATDLPLRRLHYWSMQFRDVAICKVFKLGTEMTEKYFGKHVLAKVNFTNAGVSDWARGMIDFPDWFMVGRERAASLMWSEDWTSLGPDGTGYVVDILRSAGTHHNLPVGMYIISYDPVTLPLRTYSALMHGAKYLNFYCYGPWYAFCDGSLSENVPAQKALATVTREVAQAGDLLSGAQVAPAQVALSFFKSHEIWQEDTAIQVERRNTYLALNHENYQVDPLDEVLVEQGRLARYKVFYLVDSNVSSTAAARIRGWVAKGGTLVTCAGAGLRNEYDEELATLHEVLGISDVQVTKPKAGYRERYDLPHISPVTTATFTAAPFDTCSMPVIGYHETLVPTTATVVATFTDGKPAAIVNAFGKGRSLRFAFLPGLAYAKNGKPSASKTAVHYLDSDRRVITAGARTARVQKPVACSVPRVEANLLTSPQGSVVMLANWTMQPIASLTVTIRTHRAVSSVKSIRQGKLKIRKSGGALQATLPLETTDMLLMR